MSSSIFRLFPELKVVSVDAAKQEAKKYFDFECIFTGFGSCSDCEMLAGMHIYPAGVYAQYKAICFNIVPGCYQHHDFFDKRSNGTTRPYTERLRLLRSEIVYDWHLAKLEV